MERKENMELFEGYLIERENAPATIQKYKTDVRTFFRYMSSHRNLLTGNLRRRSQRSSCCSTKTG